MWFTFVAIAVWLIYVFLFYRFNKARFSLAKAMLPLLLFSVVVTVDLAVNYAVAFNPVLNDGIGIHGVLGYLIIGDDNWSIALFRQCYQTSFFVTCGLTLAYMAAQVFGKSRRNPS